MRVAACQVNSRGDRGANLAAAIDLLERAAQAGADVAVLPEYVDYLGLARAESGARHIHRKRRYGPNGARPG